MFRSFMFNTVSLKIAALLVLLAMPIAVRSQQSAFSTSNTAISADVSNDGGGLISIYTTGGSSKGYLSYPLLSYLTVFANGVYYTNNSNAPDTAPPATPAAPVQLTNGFDTLLETPSGNDTVRTIWRCADSTFDIVQDVYPVLIKNGGQIVIRVRVVNHANTPLTAQAQYLLDVNIVESPSSSDNAKISTPSGYTTNWQSFSQNNAPPLYLAFQNDLGTGNFPGIVATGFLTDSLAPVAMGLMPPSAFAVVDWGTVANTYTWGFPSSEIGSAFSDEAVLIQWPVQKVGAPSSNDSIAEIACTSFGDGGYTECNGNVSAYTFYPYLQHEQKFPVASLVFNNSNQTLSNVTATLSVDSFFKIVSPSQVSKGGMLQTQPLVPASLAAASQGLALWTDTLSATSTQDTSTMELSVSANSVTELTNCPLDVLPRRAGDITPPVITFLSSEGSYNGSLCNSRCINMVATDSGANESGILSVTAAPATLTNMQLNLAKTDTFNRPSELYSVCVLDSMQDGFATVTVRDEAGNADSTSFTYCTIKDVLAPLIHLDSATTNIGVTIEENRPWDRGIAAITPIVDSNLTVTFTPSNNWDGATVVKALAVPIDPKTPGGLCLQVFDLAGNESSDCFDYVPSVSRVAMTISQPVALTVLPNPSDDRFQIVLTGQQQGTVPSAAGEILDLLGRTVAKFTFMGSYSFDARELPAGAYILRLHMGDAVLTERILKQ